MANNGYRDIAALYSTYFERAKRTESAGGGEYWRLKESAPANAKAFVMACHENGSMLPDDWRYELIVRVLDDITTDGEDAHPEPDIYTSDLLAWLSSRNDRMDYCDEALEEGITSGKSLTSDRIAAGQYMEMREIQGAAINFFENEHEGDEGDVE